MENFEAIQILRDKLDQNNDSVLEDALNKLETSIKELEFIKNIAYEVPNPFENAYCLTGTSRK